MFKKILTSVALLTLVLTTSACTMSLDRFGQIVSPSMGDDDQAPNVTVIKGSFPLGQPAFNNYHKSLLASAPGNKFVAISMFENEIYIFSADGKLLNSAALPAASAWPNGSPLTLGVDSTGLIYVGIDDTSAPTRRQYILKYDLNGNSLGMFKEFFEEGGSFPTPREITFDASDNIYLAMSYFYQVRKYNKTTGAQMAAYGVGIHGNGDGEVHGLPSFTIDSAGNVYIADTWSARIQKFLPNGNYDSQITWPTQVTPANNIAKLSLLSNGNFLIGQSGANGFLVSFDQTGALVYAVDGSVGATQFTSSSVAFAEAGNEVYVMNSASTRVYDKATGLLTRKYDPTLSNALGIARDSLGNTYISDMAGVKRFDTTGFVDLSFAAGTMMYDIDIDSQGIIYGVDLMQNKILKFNPDGTAAGDITLTGTAYFLDIVHDEDLDADVIYQTDATNGLVRKLTTAGVEIGTIGAGNIISPISVAAAGDGGIVVSDATSNAPGSPFGALVKVNADNTVAWSIPAGGAGNLVTVFGVAIDSDGSILVADAGGNKVVRFSAAGAHLATYGQAGGGAGDFAMPVDIMVDAGRNFYVSEAGNSRAQKFNSAGVVQSE